MSDRDAKRRALYRQLRARRSHARHVPRVDRGTTLALSSVEEGFFVLDHLLPGDPTHNVVMPRRLKGPLDVGALRRALDAVVARHEPLRTRYVLSGDDPVRVIDPPRPASLEVVDLRSVPHDQKETRARTLLSEHASRRFDLAEGPLFFATLARLDDRDHALLLAMHHIVADGVAAALVEEDVFALYDAALAGRPSPLPDLRIQYADYAAWQKESLQKTELDEQLAHWIDRLAGVQNLDLPTDRPRSSGASRGAEHRVTLPRPVVERVRAFSAEHRTTPSMTLVSALMLLLSRYSGQSDFAIGTVVANRWNAELEQLVGCFINTLAVRCRMRDGMTVADLVGDVQEELLLAYMNADVPLNRVAERLRQLQRASLTPLTHVPVLFIPDARAPELHVVEELRRDWFELYTENVARNDLTIYAGDWTDEIGLRVQYPTALFDAATIERMFVHLRVLLEEMVANPSRRVDELTMVTEDEARRVTVEWNRTERAYDVSRPIHACIEEQAARTPDAIALRFEGRDVSYRELDARANRIAQRLRRLGVGPDALVGVCLPRSDELVAALLGVLKAGGAYVAMDPSLPAERLELMVKDAAPRVVLVGAATAGTLARDVASLRVDDPSLEGEPSTRPDVAVRPDHLAYCIYTSGSTGRPKGTLNTHGGILNRLLWMQETFDVGPADAIMQKTPFSFDVSVWELFWPLMFGARMVIAAPDGHRDPAYLSKLAAEERVTIMHFVPSMLGAFLEEPGAAACRSLRRVVCSGEALSPELAARFYDRLGHVAGLELHNLYGPTEAAVDVSAWKVERGAETIPIGRPQANTRLYVLDRSMRPLPVGVPGELYLAGVQLARGYLARPELTAERFVPDPFRAGERMYRTGDRARLRPDGAIEYLGRLDDQVKIRGMRIEPAEIETALLGVPGVRECAVVARAHQGNLRLVAYLAPKSHDPSSLRRALSAKLPEHMIPSAFVALDALPLTSSGKTDRKSLPEPDARNVERTYAPPETRTEKALCRLFGAVLGVERVGVDDDFFALGGDSLLAIRLMRRAANELGTSLPLAYLFAHPTVGALARRIDAHCFPRLVAGRAGDGPAPLSPQQRTIWIWQRRHPSNYSRNLVVGQRLRGPLDLEILERALSDAFERQESLRTRFVERDGEPMQHVDPHAPPLAVVDAKNVPERQRQRRIDDVADLEWRRPPVLERGLARAVLVRFSPDDHALLFVAHQIVAAPGHCFAMCADVLAAYHAFAAGERSPLVTPKVTYRDYSVWRNEIAATAERAADVAYWRRQLAGASPLRLPYDRPASLRERTAEKYDVAMPVPPGFFERLEDLSHIGSGRFAVLVAAFGAFLASLAPAQRDVTLLALDSTRQTTDPALERLFGAFVDFRVLRLAFPEATSFRALVERASAVIASAYAHGDVPSAVVLDEPTAVDSPLARALINLVEDPLPGAPPARRQTPVEARTCAWRGGPRVVEIVWSIYANRRTMELRFSSDTFDARTAERLTARFSELLARITSDPDATLALP